MRKGRNLIGLPIIVLNQGEQIGLVQDIIFNSHKNKVLGFVIEEKGWFRDAKIIPLKNVYKIGEDAITVINRDAEVKTTDVPEINQLSEEEINIIGKDMITESGNKLGVVEDIIIDIEGGYIEGYEISSGLIKDIWNGRIIIPLSDSIVIGKDSIIVPDWVEKRIAKQNGGLKAAFSELQTEPIPKANTVEQKLEVLVKELKKHSNRVKQKDKKTKSKRGRKKQISNFKVSKQIEKSFIGSRMTDLVKNSNECKENKNNPIEIIRSIKSE